jgi:hypothetical protein
MSSTARATSGGAEMLDLAPFVDEAGFVDRSAVVADQDRQLLEGLELGSRVSEVHGTSVINSNGIFFSASRMRAFRA